jgi:intracellular multiplication protein IcmW
MPNLQLEAVHEFWDSYDRKTLYRVIAALERVEHWMLDSDPTIERAIIQLGEALDQAQEININKNEAQIIRVLATLHAGRALRILQSLDQAKPGTASQLLMYAEEASQDTDDKKGDSFSKLFLRRNLVFERLQLLSRVFSPQRIAIVLKALEQQATQR